MTTLLIATRNAHKGREISQILGRGYRCLDLNDFPGAPAALEDAETFAGNASAKILSAAKFISKNPELLLKAAPGNEALLIVADDSGLEVDALGGAPGVHSARFAALTVPGASNAPDSANNSKLLHLMEATPVPGRTARFRCVLALLRVVYFPVSKRFLPFSSSQVLFFEGVCEGSIRRTESGNGGFGYDPLFVPTGQTKSFAELGDKMKNQLSHRARALEKLREHLTRGVH